MNILINESVILTCLSLNDIHDNDGRKTQTH